jgi:hypothetical protein
MLKTSTFLLLIILGVHTSVFAQEDIKKPWDAAQPLQWSDFMGPVDNSSPFTAFTYSGISYTWRVQYDQQHAPQYSFTVLSYMNKSKSWLRNDGRLTDELLAHEQLHFDINEYFARVLLEAFKTSTYSSADASEIKQVYDQVMQARRESQELYDEQTDHSKNKVNQAAWEAHIAKLLSSPVQLSNHTAAKAEVH